MTILDTIVARKREEIDVAQASVTIADLERLITKADTPRGFANALQLQATSAPAIIAEVKRGSPSLYPDVANSCICMHG